MKSIRTLTILLVVLLAACGPTPTQQATLPVTDVATVEPASPTPEPVASATEIASTVNEDGQFVAADGSFSLVPPEGWVETEVGLPYPAFAGPQQGEFFINLTFLVEQSTLPEGFYSASMQDMMTAGIPGLTAISEEFLTNSQGEDYLRWEIEFNQNGQSYHQVYYFFESGADNVTVTYSRMKDSGEENDPLADAAVDTLKIEP